MIIFFVFLFFKSFDNKYLRFVSLVVVVLMVVNLLFGRKIEAWANDVMIKYL